MTCTNLSTSPASWAALRTSRRISTARAGVPSTAARRGMWAKGRCDMRRWTIRILVALPGLIVVTALAGATYQWLATRRDLAATPPPGRLVDIGGHRLHVWCTGDGTPAVILDTGLG